MKKLYTAAVLALLTLGASAQTFTKLSTAKAPGVHPGVLETSAPGYKEFRLTTSGDPLTPATDPIEQAGAVWNDNVYSIANSWTIKASLNFGPYDEGNLEPGKSAFPAADYRTGADGIAFVLSPAKYLGHWGEEIGYGTTPESGVFTANNSLAIEMDTWRNVNVGTNSEGYRNHLDPNGNHLAFMSRGQTLHGTADQVGGIENLVANLEAPGTLDGWIDVTISWNNVTNTLSIASTNLGLNNFSYSRVIASPATLFGGNNVFLGFTASTGSAGNDHRVRWMIDAPPACGQLRTQTQGGWGTSCNGGNPGCYRDANFASAFPAGVRLGTVAGNSLLFTNSQAVEDFLPSGGPSKTLAQLGISGQLTNPSGNNAASGRSNINGQLLALSLSVGFDDKDPNFGPAPIKLGDMLIGSGAYNGWTVRAFLAYANSYIGGPGTDATIISNIQSTAGSINENYVDGTRDNGYLRCPNTVRMAPLPAATQPAEVAAEGAFVFPNPSRGQLNVNLAKVPAGAEVQVVNARGMIVARKMAGGAQSLSFDVSTMGSGVYLVKVITNGKVQTLKAMVQE